jgi:DMSO/TMAO reductase YedYZ molybdopterin-dependent catalytic subunit
MRRFSRKRYPALFLLTLWFSLPAQGQTPILKAATDAGITIGGEVDQPLKLSLTDMAKLPRHTVRVKDHGGNSVKFEGVALVEVLRLAGVPFGDLLKGRNLTKYLLVEAVDSYQVAFALPELDPAYTDKIVLLADRRDGKPLSEREAPFRLVVPDEKMQARWIRQVKSLTIVQAFSEKGK